MALARFFDDVKKSYSAKELRNAADEFFNTNPDCEGFVSTNLWPAMFSRPTELLDRPTYIFASRLQNGTQSIMIEYGGSQWLRGIYIRSSGELEIPRDPRARIERLKWDQGIYVYLTQ